MNPEMHANVFITWKLNMSVFASIMLLKQKKTLRSHFALRLDVHDDRCQNKSQPGVLIYYVP